MTDDDLKQRLLTDPVANALAHVLRQVIDDASDSRLNTDRILFDATAAILALVDPAEARGWAKAIATLQDVANRTGSPSAKTWAHYLTVDPDKRGPGSPEPSAAARAYDYLERAATDLMRINPGAAETAAKVAVRLRRTSQP